MRNEPDFTADDDRDGAPIRKGDPEVIEAVHGGQLWETWRVMMEKKLYQVNNSNEDQALLERALRD